MRDDDFRELPLYLDHYDESYEPYVTVIVHKNDGDQIWIAKTNGVTLYKGWWAVSHREPGSDIPASSYFTDSDVSHFTVLEPRRVPDPLPK